MMNTLEITKEMLRREVVVDKTAIRTIGLVAFIVMSACGAFVRIPLPFTPVPVTLQTFFVLLAGAVLGKKWGAASQAGYMGLGVLGLPIFAAAQTGGAALFGPTGGYLFGFIAASWVVGRMLSNSENLQVKNIIWAMCCGLVVIFVSGCVWLSILLNLSLQKTLSLGLWPFLPGAAVKTIAAALVYSKISRRCGQLFG